MIVEERFLTYLRSLEGQEIDYIAEIEKEALATYVPIIRKDTQGFLKFLMQTLQPAKILEVGTAVGFSALLMEAYNPVDCEITTIENYEPRIPIARANFKRAGKQERIHLLPGDAQEILPTLEGTYDFIFMDAAKGQYIHFMPEVMRLLAPGGILVSDNVLQDGDIFESRYGIKRRNHTIHNRMREYLYALTHDEAIDTVILETGDGMAISVKKED